MQPIWITTFINIVILVLVIGIPVIVIGLGVSLGLRVMRGETPNDTRQTYTKIGQLVLIVVAFVVAFLWLFLSFTTWVPPGQSPFLVYLPILLVVLAQIAFWVLVIAGVIWLVLWLARRMGVVGPARESPLDILKARYARGEISSAVR